MDYAYRVWREDDCVYYRVIEVDVIKNEGRRTVVDKQLMENTIKHVPFWSGLAAAWKGGESEIDLLLKYAHVNAQEAIEGLQRYER